MRHYSDTDERHIRAQAAVREWTRNGLLDSAQGEQVLAQLTVDLVRTNGFLRLALALFTAVIVTAVVLLVMSSVGLTSNTSFAVVTGIVALVCFGLAEMLAGVYRFYRFGVEEMLAVASAVLLSVSAAEFWSTVPFHAGADATTIGLVVGACCGFGVYRRFGFVYAALGSMVCAAGIPFQVDPDPAGRRALAAIMLVVVFLVVRSKRVRHGEEWPGDEYGQLQAAAFAGIYIVLNLKLGREFFFGWFYWFTYVMTFVLPLLGLALGIRDKDRPLLDVSITMAVVTLVTNKPYLGWPRHEWDPILLGVLLMAAAIGLRRWLAKSPSGERNGFTAMPVVSEHRTLLTLLSAVPFAAQPHGHAPAVEPTPTGFDGGHSGGAGGGGTF